ncbi:succinylglutamate desuccinylase [Thalassotalea sp. PLHSN55]|uniref:succinylglutamate desuccinylase n=1 Tax=Thalassotalea sp. PLHSN55 TaxID=3435888 RepID=UPI003F8584C8
MTSSTTTKSLSEQLQLDGDFLTMTRANPDGLPERFSFSVGKSEHRTKVSVLDTGIIVFEPDHITTSKDIVLSSAVHGNETAPIEICQDLIQQIILGQLMLTERVLFLFGNPEAINIGQRFVEENLNRLFSGAHQQLKGELGQKEAKRAAILEQAVRDFFQHGSQLSETRKRFHYDLHTAIRGSKNDKFAVYPFRHGKPWKKEQLQFLNACGINTILLSHSPTTTFSYFSSNEFGADAFTVELGKVRPFGENDMANFAAVKHTLTQLLSGKPIALTPYNANDFSIFEIYQTINRHQQNFALHFANDVENFTSFAKDFVLATDGDIEHKVKQEGEAIIFPNANVAIGQRALLTVIPTTID